MSTTDNGRTDGRTECEDRARILKQNSQLNLSISDDDLDGEEVEVEMAEQDGDLELPDPEARLNIEQERTGKKSNCVGQAKKQKRALSLRKRTPSKRVRKAPQSCWSRIFVSHFVTFLTVKD